MVFPAAIDDAHLLMGCNLQIWSVKAPRGVSKSRRSQDLSKFLKSDSSIKILLANDA